MSSRPGTGRLGRRNTVHQTEGEDKKAEPSALAPACPREAESSPATSPPIELLPFVRLHACHKELTGIPETLLEAELNEALEWSRPESNKKFRLAVRGHYLLILDDSGSRIPLREDELIGLEVLTKRGSEGIPPLVGLKTVKPEESKDSKAKGEGAAAKAPVPKGKGAPSKPVDSAWLLVAEGGEECVHRAVLSLAGAGALRSDFEAAYHMEDGVVGTGSFGSVHKARVKNSKGEKERGGEPLVVKCIDPAGFCEGKDKEAEAIPKLLRSEMSFMLTAKGHPHILALHAIFRHMSGSWMLVTDFCAGGDAFTHIAKTGVQTEASCKVLLDGLLSALSHLGGLRILHRDVKPENLLLQTGGRPVLCDFGLACSESDPEETKRRVGSPGYISPEVLLGSACTHKADVFAAGGTLHFAMTGSAPFLGKDMASTLHKTMFEQVYYNSPENDKHSDQCKEFACLLLSKAPEERPSAAEALRNAWIGRKEDLSLRPPSSMAPGRAATNPGKRRAMTVKADKLSFAASDLSPTGSLTMGKTFSQKSDSTPPRPASSFRKGRAIPRAADERMVRGG